jgi:hypothetical protein
MHAAARGAAATREEEGVAAARGAPGQRERPPGRNVTAGQAIARLRRICVRNASPARSAAHGVHTLRLSRRERRSPSMRDTACLRGQGAAAFGDAPTQLPTRDPLPGLLGQRVLARDAGPRRGYGAHARGRPTLPRWGSRICRQGVTVGLSPVRGRASALVWEDARKQCGVARCLCRQGSRRVVRSVLERVKCCVAVAEHCHPQDLIRIDLEQGGEAAGSRH